ncbi:Amidase [Parasponia andersonii]|uniref:Amidase n=1 Tax=Parasponia andersonii TaxID=3476 RepID=A0A2P5DD87_PARAD|nr:Amidase [Parasponia andersonii]
MVENIKGAKKLNVSTIRANRKLVGSVNGGLQDPSPLVFNADWGTKEANNKRRKFNYPCTLHGIPYGLKDIISVPHYKTTWGSKSFKDQVLDIEAWVYKRLKCAGAVLVAKLVSGSLACDDIWFGGRTRNPWNIEEFSTGSSAGPDACISAGIVPFATMSLPASCCGVTALRPIFSVVGRTDVMSISESLVVPKSSFCAPTTPFGKESMVALEFIIHLFNRIIYALSHFDEWQRSVKDDEYEAQDQWPFELNCAEHAYFTAVDYLQRYKQQTLHH